MRNYYFDTYCSVQSRYYKFKFKVNDGQAKETRVLLINILVM